MGSDVAMLGLSLNDLSSASLLKNNFDFVSLSVSSIFYAFTFFYLNLITALFHCLLRCSQTERRCALPSNFTAFFTALFDFFSSDFLICAQSGPLAVLLYPTLFNVPTQVIKTYFIILLSALSLPYCATIERQKNLGLSRDE